jgi:hypothetical protein
LRTVEVKSLSLNVIEDKLQGLHAWTNYDDVDEDEDDEDYDDEDDDYENDEDDEDNDDTDDDDECNLNIVNYSTSSATQHRRLLDLVGY